MVGETQRSFLNPLASVFETLYVLLFYFPPRALPLFFTSYISFIPTTVLIALIKFGETQTFIYYFLFLFLFSFSSSTFITLSFYACNIYLSKVATISIFYWKTHCSKILMPSSLKSKETKNKPVSLTQLK